MKAIDIELTIGMPVHNARSTIGKVLDSILRQTYTGFVVLISDNASDDGTYEICQKYAHLDDRIQLIRQDKNIGAAANFNFVLRQAKTEFFMWAASDDIRSSRYFESNITALKNSKEAAIAGGCNTHTNKNQTLVDFDIQGTFPERLLKFLRNANKSNGLFYSIFRLRCLSDYEFPESPYLGFDWVLVLHILQYGNYIRTYDNQLTLGIEGQSRNIYRWRQWRRHKIQWLIPFIVLNKDVLQYASGIKQRYRVRLFLRLFVINFLAVIDQIRVELSNFFLKRIR